jgi:hypothetical protein
MLKLNFYEAASEDERGAGAAQRKSDEKINENNKRSRIPSLAQKKLLRKTCLRNRKSSVQIPFGCKIRCSQNIAMLLFENS